MKFNLGCSGFVYGLSLADGLIRSNAARRVLLITSETWYNQNVAWMPHTVVYGKPAAIVCRRF